MKSQLLFLLPALVAASPAELDPRDCTKNNCLRAVIADSFPSRSVSADCSAYLLTTVTPDTSTATSYITVVSTATNVLSQTVTTTVATTTTLHTAPIIVKRTVTVATGTVPAYASACSGAVKYSSACSCIGISPSTITAATPVTTSTITVSTTSTTSTSTTTTLAATATAVVEVPRFFTLQVDGADDFAGQFAQALYAGENGFGPYYSFGFGAAAVTFTLDGTLLKATSLGGLQAAVIIPAESLVYAANSPSIAAANAVSLSCSVDADLYLTCVKPDDTTYNTFGRCGGSLSLFHADGGPPCGQGFQDTFKLKVVGV